MEILALIKTVLDFIMAIPKWVVALINHQVQSDIDKRKAGIEKGVKDAKNAKTIEEKANAACEIQKALDPDSNCDSKPGN